MVTETGQEVPFLHLKMKTFRLKKTFFIDGGIWGIRNNNMEQWIILLLEYCINFEPQRKPACENKSKIVSGAVFYF